MAKLTKKQLSAAARAMPRVTTGKHKGRIKEKSKWTAAEKAKVAKACGK